MKIAVVGVGLYGAYIADSLSDNKNYSIDLFEKNKNILNSIAKKNQYRLHVGFHYPRSIETIEQTIEGYNIFKKKFKKFIYFPKKNYYLVHKKSLINFKDYIKVFKNFNLDFKHVKSLEYSKYVKNKIIESCVNTREGVILIDKLIPYLKKRLQKKTKIYINTNIVKIDNKSGSIYSNNQTFNNYDLIINSTYQNPNLGLTKKKFNLKFELTGMVKLKKPFKEQLGITIMDGKYCSLYPQDKTQSTISSVKYTPIYMSKTFKKIQEKIKKIDKKKIKNNIIEHSKKFIKLDNVVKSKSKLIISHKVKLRNDKNDIRTSSIIVENKLISILCGKIDAAPLILKKIKQIIYKNNYS